MIWGTQDQFSILPSPSIAKLSHFHLDPQKSFDAGLVQAVKYADKNVHICPKKLKVQNTQVYVDN